MVRILQPLSFPILTPTAGESRNILAWLSDVPFHDDHLSITHHRHPDTCSWLLANELFVRWESADSSSLFWLCGGGKK